MPSTYSQYKLVLQATGENPNTWGTITNDNLGSASVYQGIEQAIGGKADITFTGATETLTLTDTSAAQNARALYLNLTGSPGGAATLNVPAIQKSYIVKNGTGQQVTIKVSGQTGVVIPNGKTVITYTNGTDVVTAVDHIPSLTLGAALPTASGGTGSTSTTYGSLATNVTGTLPAPNGGAGITSLGTGVATFLGTASSANLAAALTDETGTGLAVFNGNPTLAGATLSGTLACADQLVQRPTLKDYAIDGSAVGNTGSTETFDFETANFFSATLDQACTFTFSNPPASGDFGCFVLELTNGGAFAITWDAIS